jgi:hypothetical protein
MFFSFSLFLSPSFRRSFIVQLETLEKEEEGLLYVCEVTPSSLCSYLCLCLRLCVCALKRSYVRTIQTTPA